MLVALAAYLIDMIFGEFAVRHPVVFMGDFILWFERRFWRDSVFVGGVLAVTLIFLSVGVSYLFLYAVGFLPYYAAFILTAIVASTLIAGNMLYSSVKSALYAVDKRAALSMLVSRDTANLSESDANKALIETYAENLSDGVIAPLFYLCLFGLPGITAYKAISTLDSMVGYRMPKYERFGKISAKLDDAANFIPSRITALLIAAVSLSANSLKSAAKDGGGHESPNAGYPIAAMAGAIGVRLGGATSYHGKIKQKPFFGNGDSEIKKEQVTATLLVGLKIYIFICFILLSLTFFMDYNCDFF